MFNKEERYSRVPRLSDTRYSAKGSKRVYCRVRKYKYVAAILTTKMFYYCYEGNFIEA